MQIYYDAAYKGITNPLDFKFRALEKRGYLMIIEGKFFLFLIETICCEPSSEPSRREGPDEGSHHMF